MSGGTYMCHIEAEFGKLRLLPANRACQFGFERTSYGVYCHRRFTFWAEKWHGQDVGGPNSGVVNADGRVHHLENFHVAGCATFPNLTVAMIAMRLPQHLETRLDSGFI
jgi:hypothetical protein